MSYVYSIPENAFIVMPAAVLFATVFTVGAMGRHSELTAAKAGGMSFHRLMRPIFVASAMATGPGVHGRRDGAGRHGATAGDSEGQAGPADPARGTTSSTAATGLGLHHPLARRGQPAAQAAHARAAGRTAPSYPGLIITADSASYDDRRGTWRVRERDQPGHRGARASRRRFAFRTMRLRALTQSPADLLAESKAPDEMRYAELGRYIDALKRSGNDANKLIVEQALKLALPATCLIIALFGAPLAVQAPARRRRGRRGDQPGHDGDLPAHHPDHEGGGCRRGDRPDGGRLAAEHGVSAGGAGAAGAGEDVAG